MFNPLEQFRKKNGLSFAEVGRRAGLSRVTVLKHCKEERPIGGAAAIRYFAHLGIPLEQLRPDLFKVFQPQNNTQKSATGSR